MRKKIFAALSAVTTMCAVGTTFVSATIDPDTLVLSNGNNIISEENRVVTYQSGEEIFKNEVTQCQLAVIVEDGKEITNESLELAENYKIEKYNFAKNVYTINFETENEMNTVFEQASDWLNDGKIKNAYKKYNLGYSCVISRDAEKTDVCAVAHLAPIITYLVYNEEDIIGDANGDNQVAANDAAYVAKNLAEKSVNASDVMLDYRADFNKDGKCTAYDCSSIAKYLAEKSIAQAETISE